MGLHVIVGAGPVGSAVARELLGRHEQIRVVTRSGSGIDGVEKVEMNANDAAGLSSAASGATAIYNCVNPPYHRWAEEWPAISAALINAAETSGALLAVTANLYGYGRVDGPMTETTPLAPNGTKGAVRNTMWRTALTAHEAGRIRMFEVRGSDYLGGNSVLSTVIAPALRKGRRAYLPGDPDAPHTFTDVRDMARLLVTGVDDERAWGRVWHAPSNDPTTLRRVAEIAGEQLDVRARVAGLPYAAVWTAGLFNPFIRELRETQHQFRGPFVMDSTAAQKTFGLTPESLESSVRFDLASNPS